MASSPKTSKLRSSNKCSPSLKDDTEKSTDKIDVAARKSPRKETSNMQKTSNKTDDTSATLVTIKTEKFDEDDDPDEKVESDQDDETKDKKRPLTIKTYPGKKKQKVATPTRQMPVRSTKAAKAGSSQSGGKGEGQSPVALLDMLAEVAAASLDSDTPKSSKNIQKKKLMGKLAEAKLKLQQQATPTSRSEALNLDQLRMLSDKLLLNMFAEMTADEIRRNYTYSCYLMPEKCKQKFNSFGNETKARLQMKTHLLGHIAELLAETNAAGKTTQKGKFMAEPVLVRKKRLAVEEEQTTSKKKCVRKPPTKPDHEKAASVAKAKVKSTSTSKSTSGETSEFTKLRKSETDSSLDGATEKTKSTEVEETVEIQMEPDTIMESQLVELEDASGGNDVIEQVECYVQTQEVVCDEEVVQVILEDGDMEEQEDMTFADSQSLHDHSYTVRIGRVKSVTNIYDEYDDEFEEEDEEYNEVDDEHNGDSSLSSKVQTVYIGEATSEVTYEIEQTSDGGGDDDGPESSAAVQQRTKQTEAAIRQLEALRIFQIQKSKKQTSPPVQVLEEDLAKSLEDYPMGIGDDDVEIVKGDPDWERRLALQCIRNLRTKKKDSHAALICQICKGRAFTAQATLMYHYRSHAGIKPFVCTICNTTFTRQHSLNYHMLIHNNKSRFTCGDCGRKFRHPSHFKEHMRRHTGETPFECSDCGVRFKTRNTYKRHLKTRHGKLLTASGIVPLTAEEFQKVKTNPKRRIRPRKDQETQWPELPSSYDDLPTISAIKSLVAMEVNEGVGESAEDGNTILPGELEGDEEETYVEMVEEAEEAGGEDVGDAAPIAINVDASMEPILAEFNNETQLIHISDDNKVTFLRADSSSVDSDGMKTIVLTPIEMKSDGTGTPEQWVTGNLDMCTVQAVSLSPYLKCT